MTVTVAPGAPSHEAVEAARARARVEIDNFERIRPALMVDPTLLGRWVVMLDGVVRFAHVERKEASRWASEHLGILSGYILGRVAEPRIVYVGTAPRSFDTA